MDTPSIQDRRFEAIGAAAASVLRTTEYHKIRTQDVAASVRLDDSGDRRSAKGSRSAVWLYNEVRSRRVLVALGARYAWEEFSGRNDEAPPPRRINTLAEAVGSVSAGLLKIARFHRVENFLITQVARGIGDIATSEKRPGADSQPTPVWGPSSWGLVAVGAYAGRCSVYTDYLAPIIREAARSVAPIDKRDALQQASNLSDLVFRGLTGDPDGPLDRIADGFAAYWFERDLVRVAGPWVRDLYAAEVGIPRSTQQDKDPRTEAVARGALVRVLMEADTLHERGAAEGRAQVELLERALGWSPGGPVPEPSAGLDLMDQRALCDAASRHGLALHRYGRLEAAADAYWFSRTVAEHGIGRSDRAEAASFMARADHNLAAAAMDRGAFAEAGEACERAYEARRALRDASPNSEAAWRRYLLTAELRVRLTAAGGRPVEAVRAGQRLLDDRTAPGHGFDDSRMISARAAFGEALLAAGHPREAHHHADAAHRYHVEAQAGSASLPICRDQLLLARISLETGELERVAWELPNEDVLAWCSERVSFRFAAEARALRATALARLGRLGEAEELVGRTLAELREQTGDRPADPVVLALECVRAQILWHAGRSEDAQAVLLAVRAVRRTAGLERLDAAGAAVHTWLAKCADSLEDRPRAVREYTELRAAAKDVFEDTHPLLLAADLDQAQRLLDQAQVDAAARLVGSVADRAPLGHGRPALESGHPLLALARSMAKRLGLPASASERVYEEY